ncbi:hypothetical protein GPALN_009796 [Globodera pallida]|nr:hypothetical protein GPALN_009796 [Globodera pallida]
MRTFFLFMGAICFVLPAILLVTDASPPKISTSNTPSSPGNAEPNAEKAESVKLDEQRKIFDRIFGEGWWNNDKAEEWHKLRLEQNVQHQIDRLNTQLGQMELNSTDQNPPLTESDHSGQIAPNSTDQNPPLTESDHFDNAKNGEEKNEIKRKNC